jgi:hypothetical protein
LLAWKRSLHSNKEERERHLLTLLSRSEAHRNWQYFPPIRPTTDINQGGRQKYINANLFVNTYIAFNVNLNTSALFSLDSTWRQIGFHGSVHRGIEKT